MAEIAVLHIHGYDDYLEKYVTTIHLLISFFFFLSFRFGQNGDGVFESSAFRFIVVRVGDEFYFNELGANRNNLIVPSQALSKYEVKSKRMKKIKKLFISKFN